ncbi:MAG: 16S rRNA (guanine(527)-N(7))-methyltransferase RsmG [Hyphomicrobiales bacterium]|nr:16S rRNA (guanine(527)-N(7))-methyltransferase RsmG [Hyphomicrobiales bacterium]MDE2114119.1 16S rRNA (guanine(527)-N(7))-methyltransferase RsmG [Hyphomicrobiales bacterium]
MARAQGDRERARALHLWGADAEAQLAVYVEILRHWQKTINLIAPSTLDQIWMRHVADCAQLVPLAGAAQVWLDFGSGAGLPGVVAAILRANNAQAVTHLVESDQRKCGFLRHVSRETGVNLVVHNLRIEEFLKNPPDSVDVVSARALAPLDRLLAFSQQFLLKGACGLFLKGQDVDAELTRTAIDSRFTIEKVPSLTLSEARILKIRAKQGV